MRPAPLLLALTLLLTTACGALSGRVTDLLGGPAAKAILTDETDAVVVEAYRIDGGFEARGKEGPRIDQYPILAGPVSVDAASRAELAEILTDDDTYLWNIAKACEFMPGVAIRYRKAETEIDVLLCFSCDELMIHVNGKRAGREDFDPRRPDLARIAKRLFPDDPAIQRL